MSLQGVLQVEDFKQHSAVFLQSDTLAICQRQQLVVVHDLAMGHNLPEAVGTRGLGYNPNNDYSH
eukprot:1009491-Amphidinium_carterae.1